MSVRVTGRYLGNKRNELVHEPSGTAITTAAPVDNQGDGSTFSPTDLCAASLGACQVTVMAIVAERDGIDLSGTHWSVEKTMAQSPRRIGLLKVEIHLPKNLDAAARSKLEAAARACPVHHSLHPEVKVEAAFIYDA